MPNWCSWTCCGRISAPSTSPPRWQNMPGGSGASVPVLAERAAGRWARSRDARALRRCPRADRSGLRLAGRRRLRRHRRRRDARARDRVADAVPAPPRAAAAAVSPAGSPISRWRGAALLWLRADPVAGRADVLFLLLDRLGGRHRRLSGRPAGSAGRALRRASRPARPGRARSAACSPRSRSACSLPCPRRTRAAVAARAGRRRPRHRCAGRRSVGKLRQAAPGGEGFRPSHPRPWRPVRPARRRAGRGPVAALLALALGRGVVLWQ